MSIEGSASEIHVLISNWDWTKTTQKAIKENVECALQSADTDWYQLEHTTSSAEICCSEHSKVVNR